MDYNHVDIRNLRKIEGVAVRKCYNIALIQCYKIAPPHDCHMIGQVMKAPFFKQLVNLLHLFLNTCIWHFPITLISFMKYRTRTLIFSHGNIRHGFS